MALTVHSRGKWGEKRKRGRKTQKIKRIREKEEINIVKDRRKTESEQECDSRHAPIGCPFLSL